jgi:hypothetical protein
MLGWRTMRMIWSSRFWRGLAVCVGVGVALSVGVGVVLCVRV